MLQIVTIVSSSVFYVNTGAVELSNKAKSYCKSDVVLPTVMLRLLNPDLISQTDYAHKNNKHDYFGSSGIKQEHKINLTLFNTVFTLDNSITVYDLQNYIILYPFHFFF